MKKVLTILTLATCLISNGWSQSREHFVKLDEYVVTASKEKESLIDVSVPIQILDSKDIELSGVINVGDLLGKYITGHLHKYNGLSTTPGIRGFRADSHGDDIKGRVLILIDGHRVGTGNIAKISLDRVERVEIIKGPASALYGSAAMGGVINIITKKGDEELTASTTLEGGSFDYQKELLSGGGRINDKVQFYAAVSHEESDNYKDPTYGELYNTDRTQDNFGGNLTFRLSDNQSLRIGGNIANNDGGYPSWENWTTYSTYKRDNTDYYEKDHSYLDAEYNIDLLDEELHLKSMVYWLVDENNWYYGTYPNAKNSFSKNEDETLGFDQQFTLKNFKNQLLVFGFTIEKLEKETTSQSYGFATTPATPSMEYKSQSIYFQDSINFLDDDLKVTIGGRYDYFDLSTIESDNSSYTNFVEKNENFDHFSPKFGINYKLAGDTFRVKANIGKGFRTPSADQLSAEYTLFSWGYYSRTLGNPDLDPEESTTFDIGFSFINDFINLDLTFFRTDVKDKIVTSSTMVLYNGNYWNTWENSGDATIEGIDISFEWLINSTFDIETLISLYSNITFNTKYEDKDTNDDLQYISDYECKSGLRFNNEKFLAELSYVLVGPQKEQNFDFWTSVVIEESDSFDFFDFTCRWNVTDKMSLSFDVLNLFDNEVEWARGYLMPERNYKVGVKFTF